MNDFFEKLEDEIEALKTLTQLSKEFKEKGFDQDQLLRDIASQINDFEVPYQFPAVQRAWVAGKLLTKTNPKPEFTRESAYEILNYLLSFRSGKKAWHSGETYHYKTGQGTYAHTLAAWKVIDNAEKAGIITTFSSNKEWYKQDDLLAAFIEDNSDYVSYDYYVAHEWGLNVKSPIFNVYCSSLNELAEALKEECLKHNFADVVESIEAEFPGLKQCK